MDAIAARETVPLLRCVQLGDESSAVGQSSKKARKSAGLDPFLPFAGRVDLIFPGRDEQRKARGLRIVRPGRCALSGERRGERPPVACARAPGVDPKPAHQLRDPATWPAEPEVPAPNADRFQAAYAHLCKVAPDSPRATIAAQILTVAAAANSDPFNAGRARLLRQQVLFRLSQGRSLRPPGD